MQQFSDVENFFPLKGKKPVVTSAREPEAPLPKWWFAQVTFEIDLFVDKGDEATEKPGKLACPSDPHRQTTAPVTTGAVLFHPNQNGKINNYGGPYYF